MSTRDEKLVKLLRRVDSLPTLPTVVSQLVEMLNDPNTQARQLAEVIAADPSLSSAVLKLANSAYYGARGKVSTISQAIVILGFSALRSVVLGSSVIEVFQSEHDGRTGIFRAETFWPHAVGTAAAAASIARIVELPRPEDSFTAGLLHGVGLLVLDQYFHDVMASINERVENGGLSLLEAQEEELGFDHPYLGAHLLRLWSLPNHVVESVEYYTQLEVYSGDRRLAATVHLGDVFSRTLGYGDAGEPTLPAIQPEALEALGLTAGALPVMLEMIDSDIERASVFLEACRNAG